MNTPTQNELILFLASSEEQELMAKTFDKFARLCAAQADRSGFVEEPHKIAEILSGCAAKELHDWFRDCELQAELARIGSEVGEAVEAVRKPGLDHHLPAFDNLIVELSDVLIRIGHTSGRRSMPLGAATVAKMVYNASRPLKHGKGS